MLQAFYTATVGAQQLTFEEMRAMCQVAEMYGVTSSTHAHGTGGIKTAVKAGVTSIEHGTMMDDECVELMVEKGTYLTPTIIAFKRMMERGEEEGIPPHAMEKAKKAGQYHQESFRKCLEAGVPIVFGTDSGSPCNPHGQQHDEFKFLCEMGMTPVQALTAATRTGAHLVRMWDDIGSVTAGKYADIIALDGNPLEHITVADAKKYIAEGQFGENSMLPKMEAAVSFLEKGIGRTAVITSIDSALAGFQGKTGTIIE